MNLDAFIERWSQPGGAERANKDQFLAELCDAIERLVFLAKIEEGLAQLDAGEGMPHEEVRRRYGA